MAFEPWIGSSTPTPYFVNTELANETKTAGYWFVKDDFEDGGKSKVVWPVNVKTEADSLAPVIDFCKGVCGTADLVKGSLTYQPFVTVGFNVVGEGANGDPVPGVASSWGGICITYRSDAAPSLELSLGDYDAQIGYALPAKNLNKSRNGESYRTCIPWSDFNQPSWYKGATKISGTDAAAQLVSINFKIQNSSGQYKFNICAIGPYGDGTGNSLPETCSVPLTHPAISVNAKWSKGNDGYDATITVKDGEKELTLGTDYEIESNVNDATGIVIKTITGKGDYTGSVVKSLVPYIDENGEPQVMYDATVLTNNKDGVTELNGSKYVATGKVNMAGIKFNGEAHLILADGAKMVIESETTGIFASGNLTIYGQGGQSGILNATGSNYYGIRSEQGNITISGGSVTASGNDGIRSEQGNITISGGTVEATGNNAGIGSNGDIKISDGTVTATSTNADGIFSGSGDITISGGKVEATGNNAGIYSNGTVTISDGTVTATGENGDGICGDNEVTINGGKVEATGNNAGIYSNGTVTISDGTVTATGTNGDGIYGDNEVTISGGTVTATGTNYGIESYNNVTINGGSVTASGNSSGINTNAGHITLGWTNSTDFIKANSYYSKKGVSITEGKSFKDENGKAYSGKLTDENLESIKNKTLAPVEPFPDNIVIANISGATYTGDSIRPEPVVTIGENVLELGKDYTLAYKDNLNASDTAKVIVKGAGKYYGEVQKLFTINKAPLKVTALNDTIVYGDEQPNAGEVKYSGFVGGENEKNLKGTLAINCDYAQYGNAGEYAITPSGLIADNYEIEFVAGKLTVEPKAISITWGEQTMFPYDGEEHVPTVTADGFVEGHEVSLVVTGAAVNAGKYTAMAAFDEKNDNSKNYKLPKWNLEKEFEIVMPIAYIDENGVEQTVTDYTVLTSDVTDYIENGVINLPGGWYVVQGEVKYTSQVKFIGDAHLILADDATIEIETKGESEYGIYASNNLTIYGQSMQSDQSGTLKVKTTGDYSHGIRSEQGNITISGGTVTVTGEGSGISASNGVTISGGTITATGEGYGIQGIEGVTISGGSVTATGEDYGIYGYNGITLGWTNDTDHITASSYYSVNGSVSIAKDKSFKDEKGKEYSGTIDDVSDIAGKTLVPPSFEGKFLSDVNIAVADIPVQKYADGKPVCPSVVVTDGKDTLTAGTDYTVVCSNNNAVTSATLDEAAIAQITGKGNYAGAIQKRFFIWNNIRDYAAVQVFQDADGKTHAEIDGAYDGTDAVAIDEDVAVDTVVFSREFTVNLENGGFSTIMLPFDIKAENLTGVKSIFEFAGVFKNNGKNAVGVMYVWCNAEQGKIEMDNGHENCHELSGELKAYTPYMVEMETPTLGITGNVTLKSSNNATNSVVRKSNWVFRGALEKKEWSKEDEDIKNGKIWAFASFSSNGASIGKFVQLDGQNSVNPFQAYLYNLNGKQQASPNELGSMDIVFLADYVNYTAVQIFTEANGNKHAVIDGNYSASADESEAVSIPNNIGVNSVEMTREFPIGKYSTTVLPFDVNTANVEGLDAVLRYNGIKTVNGVSSIRMKVVWATDKWVEKNQIKNEHGEPAQYKAADLTANTPYLVQMGQENLKVNGGVMLKATGPTDVSIDGWTFRGTWQYKKWGQSCSTEGQNCDRETGNAYGFAASSSDDDKINVGDFVRVGEGAWILPMRAYLVSTDILEGTSPAQLARANGAYVKRPSVMQEELPEFMSIVIDNGDGDDENAEHTTVIGQFNTRTGEIKMNYDRGKFDLKGRRVNGTNNARGAYYGKKVLKKY